MVEALVMQMEPREGLLILLKSLLESGKVKGVIALARDSDGSLAYAIVTDADKIADLDPLFPLMPANLGRELSRITSRGSFPEQLAVVARPCELRGFTEAIKRQQGSRARLIFISHTCRGVFPLKSAVSGKVAESLPEYWDSLPEGEVLSSLRPACQACAEFVPYNADMTLELMGKGAESVFLLHTEVAVSISKDIEGVHEQRELDLVAIERSRKKRSEAWSRLSGDIVDERGLEGLVRLFGKCVGCHACSDACPICYCTLCTFESPSSEYGPMDYERELHKRGAVRVPPGTLYFHLGRMTHMSLSCVACGSCQDVCPTDIPISLVFKKAGEAAQRTFNYTPGIDPKQAIPVVAFEKEEFLDVEE